MLILGIETTCDETGAAVVRNGKEILSNVVFSSAEIHQKYGGVFPELACRSHIDAIIPVISEALEKAHILADQIDAIAVAHTPGLIGALLIGLQVAKGLSIAWNKPLIGVSHVEAHLYAAMMSASHAPIFPSLGVVLSGGHTFMLKMDTIGEYELLGTTVDDAVGEAFDKVASLLGLPYPGGPHLEKLASQGDPTQFRFQAGNVRRAKLDFSFSGLKTAVLYAVKEKNFSEKQRADVAASFQETALRDLVHKADLAAQLFSPLALYLGGGVCNNKRLKTLFQEKFPSLPLFWPNPELTLDNAAMIAGLGFQKFLKKPQGDSLSLPAYAKIACKKSLL